MRNRITGFLWIVGWVAVLTALAFTSGRPEPEPPKPVSVMAEPMAQAGFDQAQCKQVKKMCRAKIKSATIAELDEVEDTCFMLMIDTCFGFKML